MKKVVRIPHCPLLMEFKDYMELVQSRFYREKQMEKVGNCTVLNTVLTSSIQSIEEEEDRDRVSVSNTSRQAMFFWFTTWKEGIHEVCKSSSGSGCLAGLHWFGTGLGKKIP